MEIPKDLNFAAINFKNANLDNSSICQVGLAFFENGKLVNQKSQLIDPETYFDPFNIRIHGIVQKDVVGMPTFTEYYPILKNILQHNIIVHPSPFDLLAFRSACEINSLEFPNCYWINNASVIRRTWEAFQEKGYGIENVSKYLDIQYRHEDAGENARATGLIFIEASIIKNRGIDKWAKEIEKGRIKPHIMDIFPSSISGDLLVPDPENAIDKFNHFYGKKVVISGTYTQWPDRLDLARLIKSLGADIDKSVSERTNILCAGTSVGPSKLEKMHMNIREGNEAEILTEGDLIELLKDYL